MEVEEGEVVVVRILALLLEQRVVSLVKENLVWLFWAQHILTVFVFLPRKHFAAVVDNWIG